MARITEEDYRETTEWIRKMPSIEARAVAAQQAIAKLRKDKLLFDLARFLKACGL